MKKRFVIIAPDTDCGKTISTAGLLACAINKNINAIASKPIQTGSLNGRSNDLDFILQAASMNIASEIYDKLVLCKLAVPASPLLASQIENRKIDLDEIVEKTLEITNDYEYSFIETAGGIYSPITQNETNADFAKKLKCPAIISIPNRVGAISLGVMAVKSALSRNLQVAGAVFSQTVKPRSETDFIIIKDNVETFERMTSVKVLANVSFVDNICGKTLTPFFDAATDFLRDYDKFEI
jgi:dethiobiotin synthase